VNVADLERFFRLFGFDGNVFTWSAKTWDRNCEISLPYQCQSAILSTVRNVDEKDNQITNHHILVATSNPSLYDIDLKCERHPSRSGLTMTSAPMPVHFSPVSGESAGDSFRRRRKFVPHRLRSRRSHCIMSSSDGQTRFTASEDSSIFIFNAVQPHQMVIAAPVSLALSREEQSFLIERRAFEEKQETITISMRKGKIESAADARRRSAEEQMADDALLSQKASTRAPEAANGAGEESGRRDCGLHHALKIKTVKDLYETKLIEKAAALVKEKIRIECEYVAQLHGMTEECKENLLERRKAAQQQLEVQAVDNVEEEKVERLQDEEMIVLQNEHKMEMEEFTQDDKQKRADLNNKIDAIRTDLVRHQDICDGYVESKPSLRTAIQRTNAENHSLEKQLCKDQIKLARPQIEGR
jgi:hypothetical protein